MEKKKFKMREALERIDVIKGRLNEMAENLESDKQREDFTDAEKAEKVELMREMAILQAKVLANTKTLEVNSREDFAEVNRQMRECIARGERFEVKISRAVSANFNGNASGYANPPASTNPGPLTTHDIVEPLYNKIILSAIGAPLLTGLKGNHQWPVVEAFNATINDEGAALGDTQIPLSKLIAKPERIGIAVPITREALTETDDLIATIAREYMPTAIAALMNKIMFSKTKVTGATNLYGPFLTANLAAANKLTYTHGGTPTLADLLALKGVVLKSNVRPEGMCFVMSETMKAMLEATPKWQGAAEAIVDNNGRINGIPVFTTGDVDDKTVDFGCFKYAPQGLFGEMSFIVDPYSLARKNAVDFVLNVDYAITVLRQCAFATLTEAAS